jgi:hypothetical protein
MIVLLSSGIHFLNTRYFCFLHKSLLLFELFDLWLSIHLPVSEEQLKSLVILFQMYSWKASLIEVFIILYSTCSCLIFILLI